MAADCDSIVETTKTVPVFQYDGREFLTFEEAEAYRKEKRKGLDVVYFRVLHSFDDTEGRGYFGETVYAVAKDCGVQPLAAVIARCTKDHGPIVQDWYNRPTQYWRIADEVTFTNLTDLTAFLADIDAKTKGRGMSYGHRHHGIVHIDGYGNDIPRK